MCGALVQFGCYQHKAPSVFLESFIICISLLSLTDSYFEGSESDSEGEVGGESEEAIKKRIAAEYQSEGLWSTTSSSVKDNEQRQGGGAEDDDDPLDAFMAGIEVKSVYMCRDMLEVVICILCSQTEIKKQKDKGESAKKEKQ